MKKIFLIILLMSFIFTGLLKAQNIKLYGISSYLADSSGPFPDYNLLFMKVDPLMATEFIIDTLLEIEGIYNGSSTFDHNNHYIFIGQDTDLTTRRYYVLDTNGIILLNPPFSSPFIPGQNLQFDLKNQIIYGTIRDTATNITYFVSFDSNNGDYNIINPISDVSGFALGATSFNSNSGKFIFYGTDSIGNFKLFFLNAQDVTIDTTFLMNYCRLAELEYDNKNNKLFCIYKDTAAMSIKYFAEIDTLTGAATLIDSLPELEGVSASHVFDQNSGYYIFSAPDTNSIKRLWIINSNIGEVVSKNPLFHNFMDIKCDNTSFAKAFYSSISEQKVSLHNLKIYPNPSNGIFEINLTSQFKTNSTIEIFDNYGRKVFSGITNNFPYKVKLQGINPGLYLIKILSDNELKSKKILIK